VARPDGARVLIVDDCETSLLFQEYALCGAGHVLKARDAEEALRLVQAERIDLVVLDLGLPDACGLDVLRRLRSQDPLGGPPVIVLTVRGDAETRERAGEAGCAAFLTKPVSVGELLHVARQHLHH
jgi:two-component system phosphate regulon response regulator PhoB